MVKLSLRLGSRIQLPRLTNRQFKRLKWLMEWLLRLIVIFWTKA